jgi:hypothetical protein
MQPTVCETLHRSICYRTDLDSLQFQMSFYIPKVSARAHYKSSGVLIIVQSSGGGDYWGEYGECKKGSGTRISATVLKDHNIMYEGVSKSFRTDRPERELQMV